MSPQQAPVPSTAQKELHDAYAELYDALNDAYWAASTIQDKDRIRGVAERVYPIITALNAAAITSRTAEYQALNETIKAANTRLTALQGEIDKIIHSVKIAATVVNAIAKATTAATGFFA